MGYPLPFPVSIPLFTMVFRRNCEKQNIAPTGGWHRGDHSVHSSDDGLGSLAHAHANEPAGAHVARICTHRHRYTHTHTQTVARVMTRYGGGHGIGAAPAHWPLARTVGRRRSSSTAVVARAFRCWFFFFFGLRHPFRSSQPLPRRRRGFRRRCRCRCRCCCCCCCRHLLDYGRPDGHQT